MWKVIAFIVVLVSLCLTGFLVAFNMEPTPKSKVEVVKKDDNEKVSVDGLRCFDFTNGSNSIYLCKDDKTGCQYFKYGWQGTLIYRRGTCNDARLQ